jgi:hypothetical protein
MDPTEQKVIKVQLGCQVLMGQMDPTEQKVIKVQLGCQVLMGQMDPTEQKVIKVQLGCQAHKARVVEVGLLAQMAVTQQLQSLNYLSVTDLMQEQLQMKSAR